MMHKCGGAKGMHRYAYNQGRNLWYCASPGHCHGPSPHLSHMCRMLSPLVMQCGALVNASSSARYEA